MKNQKITTAAICLAAVLTTQVQADFISWEGVDSDDWMTAANWQNDDLPDATDTARVWSDTASTPSVPNNTVLKAGDTANVNQVWVGNSGDPLQSGNLTVQSGATLTTTSNFIMENNSQLTSSGAITVNNGNGMLVRDNSNVTMKSGSTLNKLTLQNNSTATLEAGSSVTSITNLSGSSQLSLNTTYSANLTANNTSSLTVNGKLNGDFGVGSTAMQYIGATGTVNGDVKISAGDQMTVAGTVQGGVFSVNQTGSAVIEATANILSEGTQSWLYNDAEVTWNVGEDGSIGTLKTDLNELNVGQFDGEWLYTGSAVFTVVLDDYDSVANGTTIVGLQLVSGIQNEATFGDGSHVTFMLNGDDVTSDFTWDGAGTGSFSGTVVPEPGTYSLLAGCFALASVMVRRRR